LERIAVRPIGLPGIIVQLRSPTCLGLVPREGGASSPPLSPARRSRAWCSSIRPSPAPAGASKGSSPRFFSAAATTARSGSIASTRRSAPTSWGASACRRCRRSSSSRTRSCGPASSGRAAVPVVVDEARHRPLLLEDLDARGRRLLVAGALGDPAQQLVGGDLDVLGDVGIARVAARLLSPHQVERELGQRLQDPDGLP